MWALGHCVDFIVDGFRSAAHGRLLFHGYDYPPAGGTSGEPRW